MEQLLFYSHYALLLIFGVVLSAAFSGISLNRKNMIRLGALTAFCAVLQAGVYLIFGEEVVWTWYPVITHLPIALALRLVFRRSLSVCAAAIASAYLCCQPAKWFGLAANTLSESIQAELMIRILALWFTLWLVLQWFSGKIAGIYSLRNRSAWVFGITPVVYYLFDYAVGIYSSLWTQHARLVVEFLPFFLCVGHLLFCSVYYREFEQKQEAARKEQLLRIQLEQQAKKWRPSAGAKRRSVCCAMISGCFSTPCPPASRNPTRKLPGR